MSLHFTALTPTDQWLPVRSARKVPTAARHPDPTTEIRVAGRMQGCTRSGGASRQEGGQPPGRRRAAHPEQPYPQCNEPRGQGQVSPPADYRPGGNWKPHRFSAGALPGIPWDTTRNLNHCRQSGYANSPNPLSESSPHSTADRNCQVSPVARAMALPGEAPPQHRALRIDDPQMRYKLFQYKLLCIRTAERPVTHCAGSPTDRHSASATALPRPAQ